LAGFRITRSPSAFAFDTSGGVAGYYGGGIGYGAGGGASIAGGGAYSNAKTVNDLGGAFTTVNVGAGTGGRVGIDTFFGPSENGFVTGVGVTAGIGLGGTSYAGPTNTVIVPLTSPQPTTPTPLSPSGSGGVEQPGGWMSPSGPTSMK
jgi:hypothetical protein